MVGIGLRRLQCFRGVVLRGLGIAVLTTKLCIVRGRALHFQH